MQLLSNFCFSTLLLIIFVNIVYCNVQSKEGREMINPHSCGITEVQDKSNFLRIIGGREATKGRWPWQIAVLNRARDAFCGGTLITPEFVLTAAHCVRKHLYVRAGEHDLMVDEGTEQEVRVAQIFIHPDYDAETVDNDVALLRLRRPFSLNKYVSVACIPSPRIKLKTKEAATIIGWGKRKNSELFGTDTLHQAQVPFVDTKTCKSVYSDYQISENMLCAGYNRGRVDSCAGDSGGPLLVSDGKKWYVYGITSFGEGCGKKKKYGIYVKVPNYIRWIRRTIRRAKKMRMV